MITFHKIWLLSHSKGEFDKNIMNAVYNDKDERTKIPHSLHSWMEIPILMAMVISEVSSLGKRSLYQDDTKYIYYLSLFKLKIILP